MAAMYPSAPQYATGPGGQPMQVIYSGDPNMGGQPTMMYVAQPGGMQPIMSSGGMQPIMSSGMQPMYAPQMQPIYAQGMQPMAMQAAIVAQPIVSSSEALGKAKAAEIMRNGFFGCFDDAETCLCGFCCLPCAIGINVDRVGKGSCPLWCCLYSIGAYFGGYCCCGMAARENVQLAAGVPVTAAENCILHWLCCCCAIAQEGRAAKAIRDGKAPQAQRMA